MQGPADKNPTERMVATNPTPELGVVEEMLTDKMEFDEQTVTGKPKVVTKKGLKFLQLAYHIHQGLFQDEIMIGGFYNWPKCMEGEFDYYSQKKGRLKEYDVIFVGLSRPEIEGVLMTKIRQEIGYNSSTLLIATVDYAIPLWQNSFNLHTFEQELKQADVIFVPEPSALSSVRTLVNDRVPVVFMPHPTDTATLKRFAQPIEKRHNALLVLIHRYDNNWYIPAVVTKDIDYIDIYAIFLDGQLELYITPYFQYVRAGAKFSEYIKFAARARIVLDSYHQIANYGRSAVDNACLMLPTVATDKCFASTQLWPRLTTKANDAWSQKQLIHKLYTDKEFYQSCAEEAFNKVDNFGYDACRANMLQLIDMVNKAHRIPVIGADAGQGSNATITVTDEKGETITKENL